MENMELYNAVRAVPPEAQKAIGGGRLKGMTDINPMWRIQALTERFGPCGMGWKYVIRDKRLEPGANGEIAAFMDIDLFYRLEDTWSEPVPGTGGAAFAAREKSGLYTSDECFKMALTDAISVACKALGFGADVYWAAGRSKYGRPPDDAPPPPVSPPVPPACADCGVVIEPVRRKDGTLWPSRDMARYSERKFGRPLCGECMKRANAGEPA